MSEDALSDALHTYIWGTSDLPWPSERPDDLDLEQVRFLPKIRAIIAVAFSVDPLEGTLLDVADRAEAAVRMHEPDLSEEAIQAVRSLVSYQRR